MLRFDVMAVRDPSTTTASVLRVSLYILISLMAIATARPLAEGSESESSFVWGALPSAAAVGVSMAIAVVVLLSGRASLCPIGRVWLVVYGLLTTAALGVGLILYQNDPIETARDFATFIFFGSAVAIGSSRAVWSELRGPVLFACLLSVALGVVGVMQHLHFSEDVATGTRLAGRDTALNNLLPVFGMLPLAILFSPWWRPRDLIVVVFAWCSALTSATLIQSRLESVYWICCGFIAMILVTKNYCTLGYRPVAKRSFVMAVCVCVMAGAIGVYGETIKAQATSLLERLDGKLDTNLSYSSALAVLGSENERWVILGSCWNDFGFSERLCGRGMGGSFEWTAPIDEAVGERVRLERQDNLWLDDASKFGRRHMEVGWGNPFIKGGVLLTGWIALGGVVAIAAAIRSRSPFAVICALVVIMNGAYAAFGGDFIIGAKEKLLGEGLAIGFLLSSLVGSDPWIGNLRNDPFVRASRRVKQ